MYSVIVKREVVGAAAVVFIASFCLLVIELVAGRILAPYVGVSLYTWTSIIGVVLAGISVGAYLGGLLADRHPTQVGGGEVLERTQETTHGGAGTGDDDGRGHETLLRLLVGRLPR